MAEPSSMCGFRSGSIQVFSFDSGRINGILLFYLDQYTLSVYFNLRRIYKIFTGVASLAGYMTKRRKILMDYLISHTDEILPTSRIVEDHSDEVISLSAIYRNLSALEKKGKLFCSVTPGSQELSYRYIGAEKCQDILHLSCLYCGKTAHMEQEDADLLARRLKSKEGFALDREGTVLYGICA